MLAGCRWVWNGYLVDGFSVSYDWDLSKWDVWYCTPYGVLVSRRGIYVAHVGEEDFSQCPAGAGGI